ncbi:MAG: TIGR00270 family protein [Candidatus Heimdallarchaeota archaeon]|nr:TIGR00270 family protein [Candidatus Heimdallarchaeota archaeon]
METCEMCSANVANPTTIKVEGALLRVCPRCTSFGNVVKEPQPAKSTPARGRSTSRVAPKSKTYSNKSSAPESELIVDYASEIRQSRQKMKLTHEKLSSMTGISVASLKSFEAGKMRPTDKDAKRIERELGIELFVSMDQELEYGEKKKKKATTLGDIAVIRKYDYDRD